MAGSPIASIATALIGAAGAATPTVMAAIQQRKNERTAKKAEQQAALRPNQPGAPSGKPWPMWAKVAAGAGGALVASGVLYALYRAMSGGKRRRNPGKRQRRR